MPSKIDLLDRLLDALKLLEHKLEPGSGITLELLIPNSGGFEPIAMIHLSRPAYYHQPIEALIELFLLDPLDTTHEVHLDVDVLSMQGGEFLLNIHSDLASFDEIQGYFDQVLALFH